MFLTLSLVILIAAIVILFSKQWLNMFEKLTASFWMKLFLPFLFVSFLIMLQWPWFTWAVSFLQWGYLKGLDWFLHQNRFFLTHPILLKALTMTLISFLPTFFAYQIAKPFRPFKPPYWTSIYVWLCLVLLTVLPYE